MQTLKASCVVCLAAAACFASCGGRDMPRVRTDDHDADEHGVVDADVPDTTEPADADDVVVEDTGPDTDLYRDAEPDVDLDPDDGGVDADDAGDATVDADVNDADVPPDADLPPVELSCITGAYCALCCPTDDLACQLGCVAEAPPSVVVDVTALVACVATSGCGGTGGTPDFPCIMDACQDQLAECSGGAGGTAGCIGTAWCLFSSGCGSLGTCPEQGLCYQECLGAARPEVVGVAVELLLCVGASCATDCAAGLSTAECLTCLGTTCGPTLAGCLGL